MTTKARLRFAKPTEYKPYSTFDQSCFELAVQWMDDQLNNAEWAESCDDEAHVKMEADLAQTIQGAIDDWIADREAKRSLLFEETLRQKQGDDT